MRGERPRVFRGGASRVGEDEGVADAAGARDAVDAARQRVEARARLPRGRAEVGGKSARAALLRVGARAAARRVEVAVASASSAADADARASEMGRAVANASLEAEA